jgi:hypothetical protein
MPEQLQSGFGLDAPEAMASREHSRCVDADTHYNPGSSSRAVAPALSATDAVDENPAG